MSNPTTLDPPAAPPATPPLGSGGAGDPAPRPSGGSSSMAVFAVWISLVPVFMLFGALIVAYVARKDFGDQWESWPVPPVLWFNTIALLGSSVALEWSRRSRAAEAQVFRGYQICFALGLVFVVGQMIAWVQYLMGGVVASSSPHSGFFYILTAVHAVHVLGGLVGLGLLALWPRHTWTFTTVPTLSRVTAVYWHFLGFLWVTMFLILEFWR